MVGIEDGAGCLGSLNSLLEVHPILTDGIDDGSLEYVVSRRRDWNWLIGYRQTESIVGYAERAYIWIFGYQKPFLSPGEVGHYHW